MTTISPSNAPYSTNPKEMNIKSRDLYCRTCKYTIQSELAGARCGDCDSKLVTVINRVQLD